ncbi:MAG: hypothetical protein SWQ30_18440 [Thermodesulfobacteriota bacterium]|nr:hypothetical protein [Thermodesulfobacteriota bacterium]
MNDNKQDVSKTKDQWDKINILLRPVGGLLTGLSIALLGLFGSMALETKQTKDQNLRLYSELMTKREEAESKLRSEMFTKIFDTFLTPPGEGPIEKLEGKLLRLELITRNFHDFVDIKPLFVHVVRTISQEIQKCQKSHVDDESYKKQLRRLLRAAKRIKTKQAAVLQDVGQKKALEIPIDENICLNKNIDTLRSCDARDSKYEGYDCGTFPLWLDEKKKIGRRFTVSTKHAFPDWQMIHLQVKAEPMGEGSEQRGSESDNKQYWVGSFDFPIVDNTILSPEERYAIILDEYDPEGKKFKLKLLYFPATYAGMKEKSFYHQKVFAHLTRETDFLKDVEVEKE